VSDAQRTPNGISEAQWDELKERGFLRLPNLFVDFLPELAGVVSEIQTRYPYGFADPRYYSGTKPTPLTADTARPDGRILIPYIGFMDLRLLKPLLNLDLHNLIERIVGADFYLSNTWYQSVPPGNPRLSYHKDPRGSITMNILLDDIGPGMGSTCVVPGSHINTPPAEYCMSDIHSKHPEEVDMIGNAGDGVLFTTEAWHARSRNDSTRSTRRLFYNFYSRSSRATTTWDGIVAQSEIDNARAMFPAELQHMFDLDRPRTVRLSEVRGSILRKWAFAESSSEVLIRDAVYAPLAYGRDQDSDQYPGALNPYTTRLTSARMYNALEYFGHLKAVPTLKNAYVFLRRKAGRWLARARAGISSPATPSIHQK